MLISISDSVSLDVSGTEAEAVAAEGLWGDLNAEDLETPFLLMLHKGPRWQSGNTLASHLCDRGSIPVMAISGKAGSCLPLVGSLQYRTLANYMYWFPLPFQLTVVI